MLTERAKALRPFIQATLDQGGVDAICELFAEQVTELLFGTAVNSHSFNDAALGHAL